MPYTEYRCPFDNKLLFKGIIIDSHIEIKCKFCKKIISITGVSKDTMICKKIDCKNRI